MKRTHRFIGLVTVFSLMLGGCATPVKPPANEVLESADYGEQMPLEDFNQIAKHLQSASLIDPNSLMFYGSTGLSKHWAADDSGKTYFGYLGCYDFNAKNRMGGYAGKQKKCWFVRNGAFIQEYVVSMDGGYFTPSANRVMGTVTDALLANRIAVPKKPEAVVIGHKFDPNRLSDLTPGVSTIDDAKKAFGEPSSESGHASGTLLQWSYTEGAKRAHVAILFDRAGKMVRVQHKSVR